MKRLIMKRLVLIALCSLVAGFETHAVVDNPYVRVFITKIHNTLGEDCSLEGLGKLPSEQVLRLPRPLQIPFVSIGTYLKHYSSAKAYTPEEALKIIGPNGNRYRLWASESGVMYSQDHVEDKTQDDSQDAIPEKILDITQEEHGGKKLYIASLVLKAIENKLKVTLQPAQ